MTDTYKTPKVAGVVKTEQSFHKSCNTRHREGLVTQVEQFKTNEGQHCFAHLEFVGTKYGGRQDQHIPEGDSANS